jgi:hypothetical protein
MTTEPHPPQPDARSTIRSLVLGSIRPLAFILLGLAVLWFISRRLDSNTLQQLNDIATARGLITFVLAVSTVAAAMILVLAAIASEGAADDIKMRLGEGRQVLAPLIGILGTIVGFYFGQGPATAGQSAAGAPQAQTLRVGPVVPSTQQVAPGGVVTITSSVAGGRPPYTFTITLPGMGSPVSDKLTAAGDIRRDITIPKDAKPADVTAQVTVEDSAGASAGLKAERIIKVGGS